MLPFLKLKQSPVAGLIIKKRAADQPETSEEPKEDSSIEDCARELINAIHAKSESSVIAALKDIFQKLEKEPHEEGEHTNPHSYDAQNEKAAD